MPCDRLFGLTAHRTPVFSPNDAASAEVWRDFKEVLTRLDGVITDSNISGSDPTLQVRGPDGLNWTIELASGSRNRDVGLTEAAALPGDCVKVVGRRTQRFGERRIKALHLTIGQRPFELFPQAEMA